MWLAGLGRGRKSSLVQSFETATPQGASIEVGKGIIDIVGVQKALIKVKFTYHVALEYEANGDAPMPGVLQSFAYMRGALAAV